MDPQPDTGDTLRKIALSECSRHGSEKNQRSGKQALRCAPHVPPLPSRPAQKSNQRITTDSIDFARKDFFCANGTGVAKIFWKAGARPLLGMALRPQNTERPSPGTNARDVAFPAQWTKA
jgi:hypothetical protein